MHRTRILAVLLALTPLVLLWPAVSSSTAGSADSATADRGRAVGLELRLAPFGEAASARVGRARPSGSHHGQIQASVKASVLRARSGAAIPRRTHPELTSGLSAETAGLGGCDYGVPHSNAGGTLCARGDRDADRTVVVLGDSHARHWVPAFQQLALQHHFKAYYLVKQQCTAAIVPNGDPDAVRPDHPWTACHDFREWALRTIAALHPDVVVVSTSVPTKGIFTPRGLVLDTSAMEPAFATGFHKLWERLHEATDARLALIRDVPSRAPGTSPDYCLSRPGATQRDCLSPLDSPSGRPRTQLVDAAVRSAERAGVTVVDPTRWLCWDGSCPAVIGHFLPYRNSGHITTQYSRHLAVPLGYFLHL